MSGFSPDNLFDLDETPAPNERPWVPNGPEARLSIAVDRFLEHSLVEPFYVTAIHDADGGGRSDNQRARDENRGITKGQLDWDLWQGIDATYLARKLELKRFDNDLSERQRETVRKLTLCNAPPIIAWTLREVLRGMTRAGFRFLPNVSTTLQYWEEQLASWDREAEDIKSGRVVRKRSTSKPRAGKRGSLTWRRPV